MPKLIKVDDNNYVDANLIFHVGIAASNTVVVYFGHPVHGQSQRLQVSYGTAETARAAMQSILDDIELAGEEASASLGKS